MRKRTNETRFEKSDWKLSKLSAKKLPHYLLFFYFEANGFLLAKLLIASLVIISVTEQLDRSVSCRSITLSSLQREMYSSNLWPVKLDAVLPTARHRCDISSKGAVLSGRNDEEMNSAISLLASA